jgi:hypothetical protein
MIKVDTCYTNICKAMINFPLHFSINFQRITVIGKEPNEKVSQSLRNKLRFPHGLLLMTESKENILLGITILL